MPLSRFISIVIGVSVILGLMLWLISGLSRLYSEIAWTSPFLANFLVFILIILLICLIGAFIYYFGFLPKNKSRKSSKRRFKGNLPEQKNEIATENLKAVRKQVIQIQDRVAQEALLSKSKEIEKNLQVGALKIVVFGTGSAGKTSVVNALMGEMVGNVQASMGTTTEGTTYQIKLPELNREIFITDTPGILETGSSGEIREELARELAAEADLLLFVCDNDLRASEFYPLQALAQIGKRCLVVFNKIDLYAEEDQDLIVNSLKERIEGFINKSDVVKVSANPQPVQFAVDETIQPEIEITPLIKRLAAVCRAEGDDLLADNILLQSQRLGEEARKLIDQQRRREADKIIMRYQWIGAGVIACTPLPVVDMLATAAVNAQMVVEIGQVYGCELNKDTGRDLALSLGKTLVSLGVVKGAVELIAKALQLNVATYLVGKAIQGVSAAYLTRIAGKSFIEYFRHDQDWGDGGITEVVQRQFKLSRKDEFVKAFVKDAISRVVDPLKDTFNNDLLENPEDEDIDDNESDYQSETEYSYTYDDDWGSNNKSKSDYW